MSSFSLSLGNNIGFPKLDGPNYPIWSEHMKAALQTRYQWLIVSGVDECPEAPGAKPEKDDAAWTAKKTAHMEWLLKDSAAMGLIKSAVETSQWPHITNAKTSQEMWKILEDMYVTNQSYITVHYHFQELFTSKYVDGSDMSTHIAKFRDLQQKIRATGEDLKDLIVARALVLSLPTTPSWETIKIRLFGLESSKFTMDAVITQLMGEANRRLQEQASETALIASSASTGKGKGKPSRKPSPDDICNYCKLKGHWANKCAQRLEDNKKKKKSSSQEDSANLATVSSLRDLGIREIGRLLMASEFGTVGDVILDGGASSHMFNHPSHFVSIRPPVTDHITVGNGDKVKVYGCGSVSIRCILPCGIKTLVLHDSLYIPSLSANLVSQGVLQDFGGEIRSDGKDLVIGMDGEEILRATIGRDKLYHVSLVPINSISAYVATSGSLRLWHRRLGHLNIDTIRQMQRNSMVDGLSISSLKEYDHVCAGCVLGKSHRSPFPDLSATPQEKMDLIVADLTGPLSVPTWKGYRYALVMVEASCRYIVGRLLTTKAEAAGELRNVIGRLERQSRRKLKVLRTDNGTEFKGMVEDLCSKNGIIHQTTVPYTPEQNGMAERAIAVLFDMVRCMLHSSGLDLRYWGEAFMYAIQIRNHTVTSSKELVPVHGWTGVKPNVSQFRIFGSVGFVNVPKKKRGGKLQPTSKKCRLLGIAEDTKGWRMEIEGTRDVVVARDVVFDENDEAEDLAIVEDVEHQPTEENLQRLVPADDSTPASSQPLKSPPLLSDSPLPDSESVPNHTPPLTPSSETPPIEPPPKPAKASRWANLPPRAHPQRDRHGVDRYTGSSAGLHRAYVVYGEEPRTFQDAMNSPLDVRKQWESSIASEYKQLQDTGTFEWVPELPPGRKAIDSREVFHLKHDGDGIINKYKTRFVAKGFSQIPGQDFTETFSSVAKFTTLRMLLSIIAHEDWELHQVDVVGAYLQGDLDEEIYMKPPPSVNEPGKKGWFWKLKKPLYGLKQAGRQWKLKLDEVMLKFGFVKSQADDCLYILKDKEGKIILMVLVYVDDMAVAGKTKALVEAFKHDLSEEFEITDLGELCFILGIQVHRDRMARTITLNQTAYIKKTLARFGLANCAPVTTPLPVPPNLSSSQSPQTDAEKAAYLDEAKDIKYLEIVGSLIYATQTRPDIQYAVGMVAQFGGNPGKPHLQAAKRILRYLSGTAHFGLTLGRSGSNSIDLVGWTDSDWAQDPDSRRSISGFVFDVAGGSVSWSAKKQPTVALSTVEAEYMASANATKEAIWLRTLLEDMGHPQVSATVIHADNQGCIALARNPIAHSRAKHIDIRHHFIRERIARAEIDLQYCPTKDMLADVFTKSLPREAFERFRAALGVGSVEHSTSGSVET